MKVLRLATLILCLFCPCAVVAQSTNAAITGVIDDPSKAILEGVSVTAINTETGVKATTKTNGSGLYAIAALIPGAYRIEVDKQGLN